MDVYNLRRHWRDLAEIGRMYLLVVGLFLIGLLVWEVVQLKGNPWQGVGPQTSRPSLYYGR